MADFARLDDVRKLATDLDKAYPRIDVLANNADGIFGERVKTVDGFEKTFQVNHLAPFLLTRLLMQKLIESKAAITQTSSTGARLVGKLVIDDLTMTGTSVRYWSTAPASFRTFSLLKRFIGAIVPSAFRPPHFIRGR